MRKADRRLVLSVTWVFVMSLFLPAAGCGDAETNGDTTDPATELSQAEKDQILRDRADVVFSSIRGVSSDYPDNLMTADQLLAVINDPLRADDIFILDTRPRNEWDEQGHIEGATWIKMQEVADKENLARLPKDKLIVCVSPTGHTANQVCTVLRWLGYDAVLLKHGMAGWIPTPARDLMLTDVEGGIARKWPVVKEEPTIGPVPWEPPMDLTEPPTDEEYAVLVEAARNILHDDVVDKEYPFNHIFAETVYGRLAAPAQANSMFLLDIRPLSSWQSVGHIEAPSYELIDWRVLGRPLNLNRLPTDKQIIVIGDTGLTAGQVTPILLMLGYDAVTLRSGMTSWTETPDTADSLAAFQRELPVVR